ncbi:MAG: stage II sporulation protein M [Candidatus Aenigmarchaeota archaeon]|nr:stage II sporulation protein M [Candidatus Aenigmarchaeota archaeon]
MVLEAVLVPKNVKNRPLKILVLSFVYSIVAISFSHHLFPAQSSMLAVALITIIFIPFFQKLFEQDEVSEILSLKKLKDNVFLRHEATIKAFSLFFIGTTLAITVSYYFFPQYDGVFTLQTSTLQSFATGRVTDMGTMLLLMANNTQVMLLMFILSTIFGAGAVLILAWNASVIGVYLGMIARAFTSAGVDSATAFFYGVQSGLFSIALHGVPEILAYFIAGIAGGILSVGIARERIGSLRFKKIFMDSIKLLALAQILIISAAWLEAAF